MTKLTRKELLIKLEKIIGSSCYNGNIQNWGANGEWLGEGRSFRYPIKVNGVNIRGSIQPDVTDRALKSSYYAFGANQLHIIRALEEVLNFIELEYDIHIPNNSKKESEKIKCEYCGKHVADIVLHVSQKHPEQWLNYSKCNNVSEYINGKIRCDGCGSFLKSLDAHKEKCPKTLKRN